MTKKKRSILVSSALVVGIFSLLIIWQYSTVLFASPHTWKFALYMRTASLDVGFEGKDITHIVTKYIPLGTSREQALAFLKDAGYDVTNRPLEDYQLFLPDEIKADEVYLGSLTRCLICFPIQKSDGIRLYFRNDVLIFANGSISILAL